MSYFNDYSPSDDSEDTGEYNGDSSDNPPEGLLVRMDRRGDDISEGSDYDDDDSPVFRRSVLRRRRNAVVGALGYLLDQVGDEDSTGSDEDSLEDIESDETEAPGEEGGADGPDAVEYSPSSNYSERSGAGSDTETNVTSREVSAVEEPPEGDTRGDLLSVAEVGPSTSSGMPAPATPSSSTKRRTSSPRATPTPKKAKEASSEEDEDCCPICFESWTNSGRHRLCSLKCGHLFGLKCIERWIKDATKCPQCNTKAKKADIRTLYAKRLKAVDTTELTVAQTSCEKEREERRNKEMELARVRMQYEMAMDECRRLKSQLEDMKNERATSALANPVRQIETRSTTAKKFSHIKSVTISANGNCRVMDYSPTSLSLAISQPSPHTSFMPGYGLKKFSAGDLKSSQFIILHSKPIKDVRFCPHNELILTASLDQTLKITSMESNTTVQSYKLDRQVWSCCWDQSDHNVLYAGLNNGSMACYDLRNTATEVYVLSNPASRCPIVSMHHMKAGEGSEKPRGLLVQTLKGVTYWQESTDNTEHKPNYLPLDPGNCAGLQYSDRLKQCLVTYRPGQNYSCTTHILCQLQFPTSHPTELSDIQSTVVNTYQGGKTHTMLTRNALFTTPTGTNLVCVGDEDKSLVHIYEAKSRGGLSQSLSCSSPALDILPLRVNEKFLLATLTEKELKIYEQKGC